MLVCSSPAPKIYTFTAQLLTHTRAHSRAIIIIACAHAATLRRSVATTHHVRTHTRTHNISMLRVCCAHVYIDRAHFVSRASTSTSRAHVPIVRTGSPRHIHTYIVYAVEYYYMAWHDLNMLYSRRESSTSTRADSVMYTNRRLAFAHSM